MKIDDLTKFNIPNEYIQKLKEEKIFDLYPPQENIVKNGLLKDRNLVVSMPTASGKTLIATLAMIEKFSKSKCKIVYVVPLVALANEKYNYFKKFFEDKLKVTISVGDYDSSDPFLINYDIIIVTSEKLDSLVRHNVSWARDLGLIIIDEVHLLNDPSRGPTLEILITKLREISPNSQIIALSATIKNSNELAEWLNAFLLISDFRPVQLNDGVAYDSKIFFPEKNKTYELDKKELEESIVEDTLKIKKQALFFVSTRKNAENLAENLCKIVNSKLNKNEKYQLDLLSSEIENVLDTPTKQCKKLSKQIKNGVVFHHAGLLSKQRKIIEENFRNGLIKIIIATPTLAFGVNLPAFRVIIRDVKRFYSGVGTTFIPVLEYKQMTGRAGRPQFDKYGESILISKSKEEADDLIERFIFGESEQITSKLAVEPILRAHILALISSEFCKSEKSLLEFFSKTFYAFHYGDIYLVEEKISNIIDLLVDWNFIVKKDEKIIATKIGKRISELYIDPLTAHKFIEALNYTKTKKITTFGLLQTISTALEMRPLLSVRMGEVSEIENLLIEKENTILQNIPEEWDLDFDEFFKSIKTSIMLNSWIEENTEDEILSKFKVTPGELKGRLEITDWLIYSIQEISLLSNYVEILKEIRKLRIRFKYGIKEELIPLIKLEKIGRIRARKLFNANLTSIDKLRKISLDALSLIVGSSIAIDVKKQLGDDVKKLKEEKQSTLKGY